MPCLLVLLGTSAQWALKLPWNLNVLWVRIIQSKVQKVTPGVSPVHLAIFAQVLDKKLQLGNVPLASFANPDALLTRLQVLMKMLFAEYALLDLTALLEQPSPSHVLLGTSVVQLDVNRKSSVCHAPKASIVNEKGSLNQPMFASKAVFVPQVRPRQTTKLPMFLHVAMIRRQMPQIVQLEVIVLLEPVWPPHVRLAHTLLRLACLLKKSARNVMLGLSARILA